MSVYDVMAMLALAISIGVFSATGKLEGVVAALDDRLRKVERR